MSSPVLDEVYKLREINKELFEALDMVANHDDEEDSEGNFVMRFNHEEIIKIETARNKARGRQ